MAYELAEGTQIRQSQSLWSLSPWPSPLSSTASRALSEGGWWEAMSQGKALLKHRFQPPPCERRQVGITGGEGGPSEQVVCGPLGLDDVTAQGQHP